MIFLKAYRRSNLRLISLLFPLCTISPKTSLLTGIRRKKEEIEKFVVTEPQGDTKLGVESILYAEVYAQHNVIRNIPIGLQVLGNFDLEM